MKLKLDSGACVPLNCPSWCFRDTSADPGVAFCFLCVCICTPEPIRGLAPFVFIIFVFGFHLESSDVSKNCSYVIDSFSE